MGLDVRVSVPMVEMRLEFEVIRTTLTIYDRLD